MVFELLESLGVLRLELLELVRSVVGSFSQRGCGLGDSRRVRRALHQRQRRV